MAEYVEMSPGMGVLAVVGPALAVRLVSLPLLVRAQLGVRQRVLRCCAGWTGQS
ncbi:hypothetical protein [Streptomyces sp. NBC_01233]|uniref:hypothetical protein n=1 Tax=Streptomyces sp. NBC_01233 TaxID=2903787 RepID=UPI002E0D1681|nr:hypothetical protein OG332_44895 [Streptomyces sp. NBC_01233]